MTVIDMQGKWNTRIKGFPIGDTNYPVIEIYYNLGYTPEITDILDFGTVENFSYDLQIRMNTIGYDYQFLCASKQNYTEWERLHFSDLTYTDTYRLRQVTQDTTSWADTRITLDTGSSANIMVGGCYNAISGYVGEGVGISPLVVLHDEYLDQLVIFALPPSSYVLGGVFQSDENIIADYEGFSVTNKLPIVVTNIPGNVGFQVAAYVSNSLIPINPTDSDPYHPNGEPGGGDGQDQSEQLVDDETLPTISAVDTGFVTLYKPSIGQLNSLASYMWGTLDLDLFKKIFANPMDVILGLSILPGIVPSGGSSSVYVGNIDTGVSMTKVGNQYVKYDCGSVRIERKWGAFLDYSPYTKAFIYLPFIGIHPIDVDEIMNKSVSVVYNIDVLSGGCCAFVKVGGTTLYTYIGQCAASVPVTGKDWSTMINGVLGAVSSVAGTIGSVASGNLMGAVSGVASIAQNVANAKPTYQRSGSMGGMGGMMGIKTPYIIIERPVQAVPGYQNQMIGYPAFVTRNMGEFSGYTEIEKCHLDNIPCTNEELQEIENILNTGVIF